MFCFPTSGGKIIFAILLNCSRNKVSVLPIAFYPADPNLFCQLHEVNYREKKISNTGDISRVTGLMLSSTTKDPFYSIKNNILKLITRY